MAILGPTEEEMQLEALGRHILIELKGCDASLLNDIDYLRNVLNEVAGHIGATVVKDTFYQFTPQGVSGVVIIAESHLSIHTWPEHLFAAVDVFTCGNVIDPVKSVEPLVEKLMAKESSYAEIERGVLSRERVTVNWK